MKITFKNSIPELYLIASVLFYWYFTANLLNPIAMGLLLILIFQLVFQKSVSGMLIAIIFLLLNLLMLLALFSELREFNEFTSSFYELLIVGSIYLGLNCFVSTYMLMKYIKIKGLKKRRMTVN